MKNWLLTGLLFMIVSTVFSQGKITGTITDGSSSLPGANAAVKGSTDASSSDFDGKFSITTSVASGEIVISYLGYDTKTIKFSVSKGGTTNLGTIVLTSNSNQLEEIVIKSTVVDIAKDRKTPVAVSTIKASEIQAKLGTQEFPEILRNTPSVYTTKGGGGYGDSRINIRGFDQRNIAVMVNGMPINDMEGGTVYWSNWAGLSDVTSAMQVQRGLGSSKLAVSSVGGTINIVTKSSDIKEGGSFSSGFGNANYLKLQGSYNTGKLDNGLSASVLLSQTQGDGYVKGTEFEGTNYFVALGYATKDNKHDFQFTLTGAPQWHNQRNTVSTIATYQKYGSIDSPNTRYNADAGYLNGETYNIRKNYYHKPIASINWDYKINETTKLSSVFYASMGRGAGASASGGIRGKAYSDLIAFRTADGLVDYDKIVAYNSGQPVYIEGFTGLQTRAKVGGVYQNTFSSGSNANTPAAASSGTSGISQTSSINSHDWFGAVINLNKKLSNTLTLDFGVDARTYKGYHFTVLNDLLGADEFYDTSIKSLQPGGRHLTTTYDTSVQWNPFKKVDYDKISFNSTGNVRWYGAFTQLEYSKDNLTAFVQGAISQQGYKREDNFLYDPAVNPELASTDYKNIVGGNVKGGANYNINEKNNVYVNAGYYSKQPFFNSVYPNNKSTVNPNLTNEKIIGFEAGYGFRSRFFNATVNVYNTTWNDRYLKGKSLPDSPGVVGNTTYTEYVGLNEVHSGIEFEANSNLTEKLKVNAMFSYGIWEYKGNAKVNAYYQADNTPVPGFSDVTVYMDKVKVGDAAQITASLGASYEVLTRVTLDANYNFNDKLYAGISPVDFASPTNKGALELPSYGIMDAGFSYKMLLGKDKDKSMNFRLNVNNVLDKIYIAESRTNTFADDNLPVSGTQAPGSKGTYASNGMTYDGVANVNQVYFGFGRTWNFTLRYDF